MFNAVKLTLGPGAPGKPGGPAAPRGPWEKEHRGATFTFRFRPNSAAFSQV